MENQTEVFIPEYYLVSEQHCFKILGHQTLRRANADLQVKDAKLSSLHCEFILRGVKLFIKDLNSTNGVYLNRERIEPNQEIEITYADILKLGSVNYVVKEMPPATSLSPTTPDALPEWKEILSIKNLVTFYRASTSRLLLYWSVIGGVLFWTYHELHPVLEPLPSGMSILQSYLDSILYLHLSLNFAFVFSLMLFHSYVVRFYIHKSLFLKIISFLPLLIISTFGILFLDTTFQEASKRLVDVRNFMLAVPVKPDVLQGHMEGHDMLMRTLTDNTLVVKKIFIKPRIQTHP